MDRQTIDYGIDLGTTNSSIARVDKGKIKIFTNEPNKKTILPSCIHYTKGAHMYIGDKAYSYLFQEEDDLINTFSNFKRTMGTSVLYKCPNMNKSFSSEELSAEILKQLKTAVKDDSFISTITTVPADFDQVQIEATRRASELAGFEYCELLQEPIAASMAFLHEEKIKQGMWLVFDFGGGTFDVALVKMDDGIMKVIDHSGDNQLGGKNIDLLLTEKVILPFLVNNYSIKNVINNSEKYSVLRRRIQYLVEQAKIELSDQHSSIIESGHYSLCDDDERKAIQDVEIKVTRIEFEKLASILFERAICICNELLRRNRISCSDLMKILMVGGPTYTPLMREMVKGELKIDINVSIDPMTVVAQGAALYASIRPIPTSKQKRDPQNKLQLLLAHPPTTVENEVMLGIKIEFGKSVVDNLQKIFVEIEREDGAWSSGRIEIKNGVLMTKLHLADNTTNSFLIKLFDIKGNNIDCEPNKISILQGLNIANPPLPHDIGISVVNTDTGDEEMSPILKKGTPMPASGKKSYVIPKNIRPGNPADYINIEVYDGKGKTKPERNHIMGIINITGDKFTTLVPAGSEIEVKIELNISREVKVTAYIPFSDETIEKVFDRNFKREPVSQMDLSHGISEEYERLTKLKSSTIDIDEKNIINIRNELKEIDELNVNGKGDKDRSIEVEDRLKDIANKIDDIENDSQWPNKENELKQTFNQVEQIVVRYGDDNEKQVFNKYKQEFEKILNKKDARLADDFIGNLWALFYSISFKQPDYWIYTLINIHESFTKIKWNDREKARQLVERGGDLLANSQYTKEIEDIVRELWNLMSEEDAELSKQPRTDIPHSGYYVKESTR